MLNIVNEELMSYSTVVTEEKGKSYTKIVVATSNKLQQYKNDDTKSFLNDSRAKSSDKIISRVNSFKPIDREIIRISAPLKNIEEFMTQTSNTRMVDFNMPMSLHINSNNKYQPRVEVRCHEHGDDRANLYVIAFPFNGMIKPIPENPQYRIYKGLIASSVKPFFYNNRKYRKILYLVIEVNKNLFNPEHKYHAEEIDIQLESYALFDDPDSNKKKTNCENFLLKIISASGDYISSWKYNVADEAIMMAVEPGQPLWATYDNFKHSTNNNKINFNGKKKPVSFEGNMMITTNKNGIRKEVSMKNNRKPQRFNTKYDDFDKKSSLDKMMLDSGMFDNDYENRSKKNGGKNRNNRGKNRNRY